MCLRRKGRGGRKYKYSQSLKAQPAHSARVQGPGIIPHNAQLYYWGQFNSELPFLLWCRSFLHSSTTEEFGVRGSPSCIFPFFWHQDGSLKICKNVMGFYMCHKHGEVAFYRVPSTFFSQFVSSFFLVLAVKAEGVEVSHLVSLQSLFCNV